MKRKLPALLLAVLLIAGSVATLVVTGGASGETAFDPDTYNYDALYVDGAVFSWHAFDAKEGDTVPADGVLVDLGNGTGGCKGSKRHPITLPCHHITIFVLLQGFLRILAQDIAYF